MKICNFLCMSLAAVSLSGCLGSEIIGQRPDSQGTFPSLHSVPERPPREDLTPIQQAIVKQQREQRDALAFNRQLRLHLGLPLQPDKDASRKRRAIFKISAPSQ